MAGMISTVRTHAKASYAGISNFAVAWGGCLHMVVLHLLIIHNLPLCVWPKCCLLCHMKDTLPVILWSIPWPCPVWNICRIYKTLTPISWRINTYCLHYLLSSHVLVLPWLILSVTLYSHAIQCLYLQTTASSLLLTLLLLMPFCSTWRPGTRSIANLLCPTRGPFFLQMAIIVGLLLFRFVIFFSYFVGGRWAWLFSVCPWFFLCTMRVWPHVAPVNWTTLAGAGFLWGHALGTGYILSLVQCIFCIF